MNLALELFDLKIQFFLLLAIRSLLNSLSCRLQLFYLVFPYIRVLCHQRIQAAL